MKTQQVAGGSSIFYSYYSLIIILLLEFDIQPQRVTIKGGRSFVLIAVTLIRQSFFY